VVSAPGGGPALDQVLLMRVPPTQLVEQHLSEQVVIPVSLGSRVEGHQEGIGPLELRQVAPHRRARTGHQDVAGPERDVGREGVGDCGVAADLTAIAGGGAFGEGILRAVDRADRVEHGKRRLMRGTL